MYDQQMSRTVAFGKAGHIIQNVKELWSNNLISNIFGMRYVTSKIFKNKQKKKGMWVQTNIWLRLDGQKMFFDALTIDLHCMSLVDIS